MVNEQEDCLMERRLARMTIGACDVSSSTGMQTELKALMKSGSLNKEHKALLKTVERQKTDRVRRSSSGSLADIQTECQDFASRLKRSCLTEVEEVPFLSPRTRYKKARRMSLSSIEENNRPPSLPLISSPLSRHSSCTWSGERDLIESVQNEKELADRMLL